MWCILVFIVVSVICVYCVKLAKHRKYIRVTSITLNLIYVNNTRPLALAVDKLPDIFGPLVLQHAILGRVSSQFFVCQRKIQIDK